MTKNINFKELQSKIINQTFILFAILGLPTQLLATYRGFLFGLNSSNIIQIGVFLIVILITLFRKRLTSKFKIVACSVIVMIYLITGLNKYGFLASTKYYLVIIPILISFLVSYRKAIILLSIYIMVYAIFGFLYSNNHLAYSFDTVDYLINPIVWIIDSMAAFLTGLGLLYVANTYRTSILHADETIKDNENNLLEKEFNYQSIFENSNDAIVLLNNDYTGKCNNKTYALFNCAEGYLIGKQPTEYSPEFQPDGASTSTKAKELFDKALKGENLLVEWQFKRPNGELFDTMISTSLISIDSKNVAQIVIKDITEQKKATIELEKYRNFLQLQVEERTKELEKTNLELKLSNNKLQKQSIEVNKTLENLYNTQNQLIESEKMASIGILTAGVAHEINNPLNFIKTGLYSIETTLENPEYFNNPDELKSTQKEILSNIEEGITRISNIIKSLHHFNRSSETLFEKCHINTIINNCIIALEKDVTPDITIETDFSNDELITIGNDGKLHHLFLQIISNAIQSIDKVGVITISARLTDLKDKVIITISDTGIGIPKNILKRVFDPFFTTKEAGLGTGLGLSISYEIIKEHKGEINISSEENMGTTILIELPTNRQ